MLCSASAGIAYRPLTDRFAQSIQQPNRVTIHDQFRYRAVPTGLHRGRQGGAARRIAVRARAGGAPGLFWLGGFNSDMQGTKALALDAWAAEHVRACVRFDYSGHGESGGAFIDGTIGRWLEESVAVFEQFCAGPAGRDRLVDGRLDGAAAGARNREASRSARASLAGLVLIAPAPDFTEELMWKGFSPEVRQEIETKGVWLRPSQYGEPYPITRALIEEGRNHLLLGSAIEVGCPVRILQGAQDPGRAVAACLRAGASAAERRRGADHDPGRRSPPVAAAGHRADHRGGGGDLGEVLFVIPWAACEAKIVLPMCELPI